MKLGSTDVAISWPESLRKLSQADAADATREPAPIL